MSRTASASAAVRVADRRAESLEWPGVTSVPTSPALSAERAPCVICGSREAHPLFVKQSWTFARCRGCGLVSLDPRPTPAAIAAHHEASYRDGRYATFAAAEAVRAV